MLKLKREIIKGLHTCRKCYAFVLTCLIFGWANPAYPAEPPSSSVQTTDQSGAVNTANSTTPSTSRLRLAPIAIRLGGSIGYQITQRSSSQSNTTLQQSLNYTLRGLGRTYISKPWIATVSADVQFVAIKSKQDNFSSSSNSLGGTTSLAVVPYSQYPFTASISRNTSYTGAGLSNPTSQNTYLDLTQQINFKKSPESYRLGYTQSKSESLIDNGLFRQRGLTFNVSSDRFKNHALSLFASAQRNNNVKLDIHNNVDLVNIKHRYRPNSEFYLDDNAFFRKNYESVNRGSTSRISEFYSTGSYQPRGAAYYVIGGARVSFSDNSTYLYSSHVNTANFNLSTSYRYTENIRLSATGNLNLLEDDTVKTQSVRTTQNASFNYPLANFDIEGFRYSSRFSSTISNQTNSTTQSGSFGRKTSGSVQTISASPGHNIDRRIIFSGGILSMRVDQSISASESTRSKANASLNHSASLVWNRSRTTSSSSIRLSARDSRSLNSAQDSFQSISTGGTISENFNRYSSLSGSLSIQSTRQIRSNSPDSATSTTSDASIRYSHSRALGIPRLTFDSDLSASSQAPSPILSAPQSEQGPVNWENTLAYSAGRLVSNFKLIFTQLGDGSTQSLISFSVKRYF